MKVLLILFIGVFILLCISFVAGKYDFFSPSFIVCLMFFISAIFALYAVASWGVNDSIFTYQATFIILSGIIVFMICEKFGKAIAPKKHSVLEFSEEHREIIVPRLKLLFVLLFCAASMVIYLFYFYRYVQANGYSGVFDASQISAFYHRLTFADETVGGIPRYARMLLNLTNAIMYVCMYIFIHNVVLCRGKFIRNIAYLIPSLIWLPRVLFTSSRTNYVRLMGFAVLLIYIMMNRRTNWQRKKRNFKKIMKIGAVVFIIVLGLFYLAVMNGLIGRQTNKNLFDYITMYIGAPIIHFNQFIVSPPPDVQYFGQETFHGLNSLFVKLGLRDSVYSVQLEMRNIIGIYSGNVYTFFRRPLHDFGLIGMYIVTGLTGFCFSYVYYGKIYMKKSTYKGDRTLIIYGYFFYIIYLFSIMNNYSNYSDVSILYFISCVWISYAFLRGHISFRIGHKNTRGQVVRLAKGT